MKKIQTIADLKLDILFEDIYYERYINEIKYLASNKDVLENKDRKIKNAKYRIYLPIINCNRLCIDAKSINLLDFTYDICKKLDLVTHYHNDHHIFLEGFKKISEFEYEAILGS